MTNLCNLFSGNEFILRNFKIWFNVRYLDRVIYDLRVGKEICTPEYLWSETQ